MNFLKKSRHYTSAILSVTMNEYDEELQFDLASVESMETAAADALRSQLKQDRCESNKDWRGRLILEISFANRNSEEYPIIVEALSRATDAVRREQDAEAAEAAKAADTTKKLIRMDFPASAVRVAVDATDSFETALDFLLASAEEAPAEEAPAEEASAAGRSVPQRRVQWLFPEQHKRAAAAILLEQNLNGDGDFLVSRHRDPGHFVLSVVYKGTPTHHMVFLDGLGVATVNSKELVGCTGDIADVVAFLRQPLAPYGSSDTWPVQLTRSAELALLEDE